MDFYGLNGFTLVYFLRFSLNIICVNPFNPCHPRAKKQNETKNQFINSIFRCGVDCFIDRAMLFGKNHLRL